MSRTMTAGMITASQAEHFRAVILVELSYPSGTVRLCNLRHNFAWNGNTYTGVGKLGAIDSVRENTDLSSPSVKLRLSGVDATLLALNLTDKIQGRDATIRLGLLDEGYNVIADPAVVWDGFMDNAEYEIGVQSTITINVRHFLSDRDRPRIRRYNDSDQKKEYSTDEGFQYVERMLDVELLWGVQ